MEKYKQCEFFDGKCSYLTAWIPAWAAVIGNKVQLKDTDDPDFLWHIVKVGAIELDEDNIRVQSRNYKSFQASTRGGGIDNKQIKRAFSWM